MVPKPLPSVYSGLHQEGGGPTMGYFKNKLIEQQVELGDRVPAPKPAADHVALQCVEFEHQFASQCIETAELSQVKNKAFDDGWNHGFNEAFDEGWHKGFDAAMVAEADSEIRRAGW